MLKVAKTSSEGRYKDNYFFSIFFKLKLVAKKQIPKFQPKLKKKLIGKGAAIDGPLKIKGMHANELRF